ncbi:pyruvate, water dikinase regulatory protein [uncultured Clostridium sp.]|uniref:pyruvate, water dikinase regulatory protein n=1 Tax=uncultured Clostridium sp. TaxID=59620 RepID=UPI0028EE2F41|nr:pyruvate, water dikinase regulatory protein [uncultured Clostridium sp.]
MLTIYAVSDSIGETAEQVARATASQFKEKIRLKRVIYIKNFQAAEEFLNSIESPNDTMIINTIVLVDVREFLIEKCVERGINIINILGPCINTASKILNRLPDYKPGALRSMDARYDKRIEAMEFAMRYDDSKDHKGIKVADVILVGLSRTSKTPLCMYLANKGIKALNIPLMPEVPLPEELFEVDNKKVVGLTIDPIRLMEIRKHRMDKFSMISSDIQYANGERVLDELEYADRIMKRLRCKVIDVTNRAIEDTALLIMDSIGYGGNKDY